MMRLSVGKPLIKFIKLCYAANRPPLLIGVHGVGKSEVLRAAADEMKIDFISRDLSLLEPPDLVGMPQMGSGVTRYCPPAFLPTKGKGLIVFEELNRCPNYMRAPCLQLLTERSLNDYRLPSGWLPAAAINPPGADYEVADLDTALLSRFVQVQVQADQEEWLAWARINGVHADIITYVASDADIFSHHQSNPRSWSYVSDLLHAAADEPVSQEAMWVAVSGVIGEKRAVGFRRFLKDRLRPLMANDILSSYPSRRPELRKWIENGQLDLVHGSLLALLKFLQAKTNYEAVMDRRRQWGNLAAFLADLPGDLQEQAERFFKERGYRMPARCRS